MEAQTINSVADVLFDVWNETQKESTFRVSGRSMCPLIEPGNKVIIRHSRAGIKPGMLIAFRQNNRIIVHRVLRKYSGQDETVYLSRGDHNRHLDPRIRESEIVGKVISIERNDKRIFNVANPYWRAVGKLVVQSVNLSRLLPGELGNHRLLRIFGVAFLRSTYFV